MSAAIDWVVLTQGTRSAELESALASLRANGGTGEVVVVDNGGERRCEIVGVRVVRSDTNLGVPGGRDRGLRTTEAALVGFLDDDARLLTPGAAARIAEHFERSPDLGAISFRILDDEGESARRHVPRVNGGSVDRPGRVATFLGGACVIRRSAYLEAGGYWSDLFYAHEELELSWRLHDVGYGVMYEPAIEVGHPRTPISRHEAGWGLTGRNRVMVARRSLPWPVALAHVSTWLVAGLVRAPDRRCKAAYVRGWRSGWSRPVDRRPIRWGTVWRLARVGRPPII